MQTFLPYRSFNKSAAILDYRRLGRQRVEVLQILRALHYSDYGWQHHPAVIMWRGRVDALVCYGMVVVAAWRRRGYADSTGALIAEFASSAGLRSQATLAEAGELPPWLGWRPFHRSHQSALVRKDPTWYRRYFPRVPDDLPYVWPVPS